MKYQQVSVDFVNMVFTATTYLALAAAAWIFLRLVQACFWLPRHLKKQNNIQQMLQDKVDSYEKYIMECEEKEKAESEAQVNEESFENIEDEKRTPIINEEKWKERRECLEMLKKELKRVRDGGDMYDWDYLLEDDKNGEKDESEKDQDTKTSLNAQELLSSDNEKSDESTEIEPEAKKDK